MKTKRLTPKVGDVVRIRSDRFQGEAVITYILEEFLFIHSYNPIQCEISEGDLHLFSDFNHGQTVYRTNLREIIAIELAEHDTIHQSDIDPLDDYQELAVVGTEQGSLFDDF